MEGGGEMTKTPQISQGGSAVAIRLKQNAWRDRYINARSHLDQEIAPISENFLTTPL